MADISDSNSEVLLTESAQMHGVLMAETKANIQHRDNVAGAVAVKNHDEVGPIEAAATEVVLRKAI